MIRELGSKMLYYYRNLGLRFGGVSFTSTVFGCGENAALHCRTNVDYCTVVPLHRGRCWMEGSYEKVDLADLFRGYCKSKSAA